MARANSRRRLNHQFLRQSLFPLANSIKSFIPFVRSTDYLRRRMLVLTSGRIIEGPAFIGNTAGSVFKLCLVVNEKKINNTDNIIMEKLQWPSVLAKMISQFLNSSSKH